MKNPIEKEEMLKLEAQLEKMKSSVYTSVDYDNDSGCIGCYSIYDSRARQYDTPFFAQSDLFAGRHFDMIKNQEGLVKQYPDDFELHRIGYFNSKNADFNPYFEKIGGK